METLSQEVGVKFEFFGHLEVAQHFCPKFRTLDCALQNSWLSDGACIVWIVKALREHHRIKRFCFQSGVRENDFVVQWGDTASFFADVMGYQIKVRLAGIDLLVDEGPYGGVGTPSLEHSEKSIS